MAVLWRETIVHSKQGDWCSSKKYPEGDNEIQFHSSNLSNPECNKDNKDHEAKIREYLPDANFSKMVTVLKKFYNFMNLTASSTVASNRGIKATEMILKTLEKADAPEVKKEEQEEREREEQEKRESKFLRRRKKV